MTLTFFFNVTDTGSWLEIGQSISHFCITSLLLVFSGGIAAAGRVLMGDSLGGRRRASEGGGWEGAEEVGEDADERWFIIAVAVVVVRWLKVVFHRFWCFVISSWKQEIIIYFVVFFLCSWIVGCVIRLETPSARCMRCRCRAEGARVVMRAFEGV